MAFKNSDNSFGAVAKWMHWISALTIFGLFGLGLWMRSLGYYDEWYHRGPELHKSIGIVLAVLIAARLVWRWINPQPHDPGHKAWERKLASWIHRLFYGLLFALFIAGYLISTADGHPIHVFGLFEIPSIIKKAGLEDQAGAVHEFLAYALMALAALHVAGALKHHILDRDETLRRMLPAFGRTGKQPVKDYA